MSDDLVTLNAARRWWLDRMPYLGRVPADDEVLEAYAKREQETMPGMSDDQPLTWQPGCHVYWGSHGCHLARGHEGDCWCDCCDCVSHPDPDPSNPGNAPSCVAGPPYYGPVTRFWGDDVEERGLPLID